MNRRPSIRALAWLAFLGPFFLLTYSLSNAAAAHRDHVSSLMFGWERGIPFLAWTIVPYWSSDFLYAFSMLVCRTRDELSNQGKRLIAIQLFATSCFLAFPLQCAWTRPLVTDWTGPLFTTLRMFDQPFNQAPSLHAATAVIVWARFREHTRGGTRTLLAGWLTLVTLSTLTTHQHHFIDIPTGLWAGLLVVAALPERRLSEPHTRLTMAYLSGAICCTVAAFALQGFAWLLLWPGFALSMVAAAYWTGDARWLGTGNPAAARFMLPYTVAAWINSRCWTRGHDAKNPLTEEVWIGRAPSRKDLQGIHSVVDLAPELLGRYGDVRIGMLDLVPPTDEQLDAAVRAIAHLRDRRPTLVCCALGYSRSAISAAAWLISEGRAISVPDAIEQVRHARPQVVFRADLQLRLEQWAAQRTNVADRSFQS